MWRRILIGLVLSLSLVIAVISYVLWVPGSVNRVIQWTQPWLPDGLHIGQVQGVLTQSMQISSLTFENASLRIAIDRIDFAWDFSCLREKKVCINQLKLTDVDVEMLKAPATDQPEEPLDFSNLPAFNLPPPWTVEIRNVEIEAFSYATGDQSFQLERLQVDARMQDQHLTLQKVHAQWLENSIELQGEIYTHSTYPMALTAAWSLQPNLLTPLHASIEEMRIINPIEGKVTLDGSLQHLMIELDNQITTELYKDIDLTVKAQIYPQESRSHLDSLQLSIAESQLELQGDVFWKPEISWTVNTRLQNLDLSVFQANIPETLLHAELESFGTLHEQLNWGVHLRSISGDFNHQPIKGSGRIEFENNAYRLEQISLQAAGSSLTVAGSAQHEQLDLNVAVDIPDFSQLYTPAQGALEMQAKVQGRLNKPLISSSLLARNIQYDTYQIDSIQSQIQLDMADMQGSTLNVDMQNIRANEYRVERLSLAASGTTQNHTLQLDVASEEVTLALTSEGTWIQNQYSGQVIAFNLSNAQLGEWETQTDVAFELDAKRLTLNTLCLNLENAQSRFCMDASRDAQGQITSNFSLENYPLIQLNELQTAANINAHLSLQGEFLQLKQEKPRVFIDFQTDAVSVDMIDDDLNFLIDPILAQLTLEGEQLQLSLRGDIEQLDSQLRANVMLKDIYTAPLLDGELQLDIANIALIETFSPNLMDVRGKINSNIRLSGTLAEPRMAGHFHLREASLDLPGLGININPIELTLESRDNTTNQVDIRGSLTSGEGVIQLLGAFDPFNRKGTLTIRGDDFLASDNSVFLTLSPDLLLDVAEDINLTGRLKIPDAIIQPPSGSQNAGIGSSNDIVFIGEEINPTTSNRQSIRTQITLELGENVFVEAFGFSGQLAGEFTLQDDTDQPTRAAGIIQVLSGTYQFIQQGLEIRRGNIIFSGGPISNPGLDLAIGRKVGDVDVGAQVTGTLIQPLFALFSTPSMPDSSIISYITLGRGPNESTASEQALMLRAAIALSMRSTGSLTANVQDKLELDEFGFSSTEQGDSAFYIGKYLTPRLFVRYGLGLLGSSNVLSLSYRLSSLWKIETQRSDSGSGADLLYTLER